MNISFDYHHLSKKKQKTKMSEFICASSNNLARSASLSAFLFLEYINTASTHEYQGPVLSLFSKVKKCEAGLVFCLYKSGKDHHNLALMIYFLTPGPGVTFRGVDGWGRGSMQGYNVLWAYIYNFSIFTFF